MRQLSLLPQDLWLQNGRLAGLLPPEAPIIVSNGVGVDSVALLVELHRLNVVPTPSSPPWLVKVCMATNIPDFIPT